MDIRIVIEASDGEHDVIPLDTVVDLIQRSEIPRNVLQAVVDAVQDHLINSLCGEKYSRNNKDFNFERCATKDNRIFITELGTIRVKAVQIRNKQSGEITTPIVKYLDMNDKQRVTNSLRMKIANLATSLSYREVREYLLDFMKVNVSIGTIQNAIEEEGKLAKEKITEDCKSVKLDHLFADETESHSTEAKKNLIRVVVGTKIKEKGVTPVTVSVNKKWNEIGETVKKLEVTNDDTVLISDGQEDLIEAFNYLKLKQRSTPHIIRRVSYYLWESGVSKEDRKRFMTPLTSAICTLRNSAAKHLKDKNMHRLNWRISETKKELTTIISLLRDEGYEKIVNFLERAKDDAITFAELALVGRIIPDTTNQIERVMGEISGRIKHIWSNWAPNPLEHLLNICLLKWCDREGFRTWQKIEYLRAIFQFSQKSGLK
jgi:hypothetical protein